MKKLKIVLVTILTLLVGCKDNNGQSISNLASSDSENSQDLKRYDVKSGMVTYKITTSGKMMGGTITGSGSENLYFKNWGAIELVEAKETQTTKMKIFGKATNETSKTHTLNKLDNGKSYSVDFKAKEIYAGTDMAMEMTKMFQPNKDAGKVGKNMLEGIGGKKIGEEKILGYNCEIWEAMGTKQWIYEGLTLKLEAKIMGINTLKEATSAEFNTSISDKYFQLPDYPLVKLDTGLDEMDTYDINSDEAKEEMEQLKKMSYDEWKEIVIKEDDELKNMSDTELRQTYDMMQKMIRLQD